MKRNGPEHPNGTVGTTSTEMDDSLIGRGVRSSTGKRCRWVFVLGLVLCSLAAMPVVSAHAYLVDSAPEDGSQLTDAPEEVTLQFSSNVLSANITVADLADNRVDTGQVSQINATTFRVPLGELDSGAYTVEWQIVSADGHQLNGSFTFVVVSETPSSQSVTKTATQTTTENGTTQTPITTSGATERPTGRAGTASRARTRHA
jgi:methionine-rich copper-binding protein CopC